MNDFAIIQFKKLLNKKKKNVIESLLINSYHSKFFNKRKFLLTSKKFKC